MYSYNHPVVKSSGCRQPVHRGHHRWGCQTFQCRKIRLSGCDLNHEPFDRALMFHTSCAKLKISTLGIISWCPFDHCPPFKLRLGLLVWIWNMYVREISGIFGKPYESNDISVVTSIRYNPRYLNRYSLICVRKDNTLSDWTLFSAFVLGRTDVNPLICCMYFSQRILIFRLRHFWRMLYQTKHELVGEVASWALVDVKAVGTAPSALTFIAKSLLQLNIGLSRRVNLNFIICGHSHAGHNRNTETKPSCTFNCSSCWKIIKHCVEGATKPPTFRRSRVAPWRHTWTFVSVDILVGR